jgi:hypothetical protein
MKKNFRKLKVGAWYKDGLGDIEQVIAHHPNKEKAYQYETDVSFYFANGRLLEIPTDGDLIERVNPDGTRWEPKS